MTDSSPPADHLRAPDFVTIHRALEALVVTTTLDLVD